MRAGARSNAQLPVILVFGGFQKAGEVIELMRRTGLGEDYALASFDYPFEPPRRLMFPESLFWIPKLHQMFHETFEGIGLLDAHLSEDARFNPRRRVLLGASLGAPKIGRRVCPKVSQFFKSLRERMSLSLALQLSLWKIR